MKQNDGMQPDRHLQQALKHAPDTALSAPPALSARIIAAARDAAAADRLPAPGRKAGWWAAWLQPRPGNWSRTGAFATVVMAVLLSLLWPAQTPGPVTEGETTVAQAPLRQGAPAAAPESVPLQAAPQQETAAPPATTATEQRRQRVVAVAPARAPTPNAAPAQTPAPAPADMPTAAAPAPRIAAPAIPSHAPVPVPPPSPLPATAARAPAPSPAPAADTAEAAPRAPAAAVAAAPTPAAAAKAGGPGAARASADATPAFNTPSLQAGLVPMGQSSLSVWLQRQPPGLAWRIDGAPAAAASLPWLQRLGARTGSRWQPVVGLAAASSHGATTVQLLSAGGNAVAQLVLHADQVLWCDSAGACSRSLLTPEVMATLEKELPR